MDIDDESMCRICGDTAQYNIFQDELDFGTRNMKIYIVLNNFIFEKLYGPDEFSDLICTACCDSLYNSYQFMIKVRDSEHRLHTEGPPPKKLKSETKPDELTIKTVDLVTVSEIQDDILGEDILETEYSEEELIPASLEMEVEKVAEEAEKKEEKSRKRAKQASPATVTDSVTFSNFSLVYKEENDRIIANIHIDNRTIANVGDNAYTFDNILENPGEASYFSCTYCVKGFSSVDFLLKHISSCHFCLTCFKICDNNKDLNQHAKTHNSEKLVCSFCGKICNFNAYRPHLRKQHVTNLPSYVGVLPSNLTS